MPASTSSYSQLMFAQGSLFWACVNEATTVFQRIKNRGNKGVMKDGSKYSVKESVPYKLGFSMRPLSSEGGARPTHYAGASFAPEWTLQTVWCPVQITGMARDVGDLVGMVDVESVEMQQTAKSVAWFFEAALRSGDHFILSKILEVSGSDLVVPDASVFRIGMRLDSFTTPATPKMDSRTVVAINPITNTITMSAATSAEAGDYLSIEDAHGYGLNGFMDLVNDGNSYSAFDNIVSVADAAYAGITRATYAPSWNACIRKYGEGPFSTKQMSRFLAEVRNHQHKPPEFTACYCSTQTAAALWEGISVKDREMSDTNIKYGTEGDIILMNPLLKHKKVTVVPIDNWWRHSLWFINEDDVGLRWPTEPTWRKGANGETLEWNGNNAAGYDLWTGSFYGTLNLIGHPSEHAILLGISDIDQMS
ncbi:MAG: hypothetical protein ABIK37_05180 [candidate division WOR-3 bacterium]